MVQSIAASDTFSPQFSFEKSFNISEAVVDQQNPFGPQCPFGEHPKFYERLQKRSQEIQKLVDKLGAPGAGGTLKHLQDLNRIVDQQIADTIENFGNCGDKTPIGITRDQLLLHLRAVKRVAKDAVAFVSEHQTELAKGAAASGIVVGVLLVIKKLVGAGLLFTPAAPVAPALIFTP